MFVTESVIHERRIGPGDLVFMVGLFTRMTGKRKNFPIVRIGNMAMMPSEKRRFHDTPRSSPPSTHRPVGVWLFA
jgi:hypothetical protein